jgi:hypothetical protein
MNWCKMLGSKPEDIECIITIPNPVEPEYPMKIQVCIFTPYEGRLDNFGRADLKIGSGTELFRVYHPDLETTKTMMEEGLKKILGALSGALP